MTRVKIRPAEWSEVVKQFDHRKDPAKLAQRQANRWAKAAGFKAPKLKHCRIYLEQWHGAFIASVMDQVKDISPLEPVQRNPRHVDWPMTFLKHGSRYYVLDGKHRAHVWAGTNDWYEALVIYP